MGGHARGAADERDLFPAMLRTVSACSPKAVLLENVKGFTFHRFRPYLKWAVEEFEELGYDVHWCVESALNYGVPQKRERFILVALRYPYPGMFEWPTYEESRPTVGETLKDLMAANGWPHVEAWAACANGPAMTLSGGSARGGGARLSHTTGVAKWRAALCVDSAGVADSAPGLEFEGVPKLTLRMAARLQGFPDSWEFMGRKTSVYRQIANAFPPPWGKESRRVNKSSS